MFKSIADSVKHTTLIHGKSGKEANPLGHSCNHIVEGVACGLVFETPHFLAKHKQQEGHMVSRKKLVQKGS